MNHIYSEELNWNLIPHLFVQVVDGTWVPNQADLAAGLEPGFGVTTNIINGGIECGKGSELAQSKNRQEYFRSNQRVLNKQRLPTFVSYFRNQVSIYFEVPGVS